MAVFDTKGLVTGLLLIFSIAHTTVEGVNLGGTAGPKDWLTWGPYRPGLYFGVRPNVPETLLMGLMWGNGTDGDSLLDSLRDTCEQGADGIYSYSWTLYDPREGGIQTLHDAQLGVDLTTEFVKNEDGSGWAVRVTGEPNGPAGNVSLIFHVAWEQTSRGWSSSKGLECGKLDGGHLAGAECKGRDPALGGGFEMRVNADPQKNSIGRWEVRSKRVSEDRIWRAKDVLMESVEFGSDKGEPGGGNMHFVRFDFQGPFTATFSYRDENGLHTAPDAIIGKLDELQTSFSTQTNKVFPLQAPFRDRGHMTFAQSLLSNLLGGLGFFHGDSKVDFSHGEDSGGTDLDAVAKEARAVVGGSKSFTTKPSSLLSFTPSRSLFPRGFLWDEGFHLLPVIEWDIDLAVAVLRSWLDQMDSDGWIAREQILGPEARSRVPEQFQVQDPDNANPPTFTALVLPALLAKLIGGHEYNGHLSLYLTSRAERTHLLRELYPHLALHHERFRQSQAGDFSAETPRPAGAIPGEGFRWRGRTADQHTLPSGLDDYPRAAVPSNGELHVDALAWAGASARALQQLASFLQKSADAEVYGTQVDAALHNLEALHWNDGAGAYCDATTTTEEAIRKRYEHVCHVGYVSFMPFLVGLVNASHPRLPVLLNTLAEHEELWSAHGVRSLSARDEYYGKGEDYSRGKVWVNMNVLAVLRLWEVGKDVGGTASEMAAALRRSIVETVYDEWVKTSFIWESYDDKTGEGKGARGFTGWGSCLLLILGLQFSGGNSDAGLMDGEDKSLSTAGGLSSTVKETSKVSTQTVLASVLGLMMIIALRRRIVRWIGRAAGYWRSWRGEISSVRRIA